MLGWWITISTSSPEEIDCFNNKGTALAHWEVGVPGIRWLEQLTRQGEAQQLKKAATPIVGRLALKSFCLCLKICLCFKRGKFMLKKTVTV